MKLENTWYIVDVMKGRPPTKNATDFGKRVSTARKERGLTQKQFAELLGVSSKMVEYYERRASNVTADVVKNIADVLKISADELLGIKITQSKPGPKSKLRKQIEQIEHLPKGKQHTISEILDMAVKAHS